ncbi:MAG: SDR family NAD(P)-dependent oxidoreductase [Acidobacteria bacterium]|nr:SDR family NAD(P)-dependent oxidoreductase [Acidobacteriota bacterium]
MSGAADQFTPLQRAALALKQIRSELERLQAEAAEPIAIVGAGCRFPGGVADLDSYWELLRGGVDAIAETPPERWDPAALYDADPDAPGKLYARFGGYLDRVGDFDAEFFGISPREAERMDPQQRLLLEVAWEALENAGQSPERLAESQTGVFIGISGNDYATLSGGDLAEIDPYTGTGNTFSVAAGRLSYFLKTHGPSLAIDTACSSSLAAVHLACQSLRANECSLALAGGVNLILTPDTTAYLCRLRALAPDGRCKTFDASADGYVRGEGCGVVALKRLSAAQRDGDPILAVIRGSAVNNDGRSNGLTAPNGAAQEAVLREALRRAGVEPRQVGLVEAHGTGTPLGDPIELQALAAVTGEGRPADRPLAVGSVKTNFGHLEAAAGVAGLIKAALAIRRGVIPPHLHFRTPNPHLQWDRLAITVPTKAAAWETPEAERIAGVSSFGISGTNAHVILGAPPSAPDPAQERPEGPYLLPLSARRPEALAQMAARVRPALAEASLYDLCRSAALRRGHFERRLAIVGSSAEDFDQALEAFLATPPESAAGAPRRPKVVFAFPGQGGQWQGMGRELLAAEPAFRAAVEACDRSMRADFGGSVLQCLESGALDGIERIQPALFAVQVGLAALWKSWGIEPDAVVGHSMGEAAAAFVAGALSLDDAARIICRRSALLRRISGRGAMAIVELSRTEAALRLDGLQDRVSVAVSNSARSTVLSGDPSAIDELLATLEREGVFCRRVKVEVASHSPQVDELRADLHEALRGLAPRTATVPFYSTVTGEPADGRELDGPYWLDNLRRPVLFADAVRRLLGDDHHLFLEIGPHPVLLPAVEDGFLEQQRRGRALASLRREQPERAALLESLGALYELGHSVDWEALYRRPAPAVALPSYPWQRERFWLERSARPKATRRDPSAHPLLGPAVQPADQADRRIWQAPVSVAGTPYLGEHRLGELIVFPAAGYAELALGAARDLYGDGPFELRDLRFEKMLVLPEDSPVAVQVSATQDSAKGAALRIDSRPEGPAGASEGWTLHAAGSLRAAPEAVSEAPSTQEALQRCGESIAGEDYYRGLSSQGLAYGPTFSGIVELRRSPGEAVARLKPPADSSGYLVHPALLDLCFQAMGAALPGWEDIPATPAAGDAPYLPVGLDSLVWRGPARGGLTVHCRLVGRDAADQAVRGDLWLRDGDGNVVLEARGFRVRQLGGDAGAEGSLEDWLYRVEWRSLPLGPSAAATAAGRWVLRGGGRVWAPLLAARLEARGATAVVDGPLDSDGPPHAGVLYAPAVDATPVEAAFELVSLVQAIERNGQARPPRLAIVTSGAQGEAPALAEAPLWGLARTIALEHPELRSLCVDLSAAPDAAELDALCEEIWQESGENQVTLRGRERRVARLVRFQPEAETAVRAPAGDRDFRLEIDQPGILDALTLRGFHSSPPGPGEVRIRVHAAGLNFLDVLAAMGVRPDQPAGAIRLGGECAGTVSAVGEGVKGLQVGDAVAAIAPSCFTTSVTTPAVFVAPLPKGVSFEEAATIPIAFVTAYYAMTHVGRLQPGESVLIHSASGGVGLAALQIARWLGVEVFATAGSAEKRDFLRGLGVEHVFDSRNLGFVQGVLDATGGRGVDAVLNSLTGDALVASLDLLAPYGRFLEIGKKDVYGNHRLGLFPFRKNLTYSLIDLARMLLEKPALCSAVLREVMEHIAAGRFRPLERRVVGIEQASEAFHEMAQARHIGKLVLSTENAETTEIEPAPAPIVRADGSYLVTGGLGGLGLSAAGRLAEQGAGGLALLGRGEPSPDAQRRIDELRAGGTRVEVIRGDVSRPEDVRAALARIDASLPPLRGILHAAGVLDDRTILQLDRESLRRTMAPKVDGAWNLHELTLGRPLDFFVAYSSGSGLLGTPGQGNYAAANAFLDALAHHRRGLGLPGLSVNWGPFSEVGMVASQVGRLAGGGMGSLTPAQGLEALERLLRQSQPQAAVLPFRWASWRQATPLLSDLIAGKQSGGGRRDEALCQSLAEAEPDQRPGLLEKHLREQLAAVLRLPAHRIGARTPFNTLGLDSLMALELRNRLEAGLGLRLPATLVWKHPTVEALAAHLAELTAPARAEGDAPAPDRPAEPETPVETGDALDRIGDLSDEEVERLFAEKLLKGAR